MIETIIGDVIGEGQFVEYNEIIWLNKKAPLYNAYSRLTDDSVMTAAVFHAVVATMATRKANPEMTQQEVSERLEQECTRTMRLWGNHKDYWNAGYGANFCDWLEIPTMGAYNSFGNGSAMRVSPVVLMADSLEEVLCYAEATALPTHNHPEGIKGAQVVAAAGFMAKQGYSRAEIYAYAKENYYPQLDELKDLMYRDDFDPNRFLGGDLSCQRSVPQCIVAACTEDNFEDAMRKVISLGGDKDTQAAITNSITYWLHNERDIQFITEQMVYIWHTKMDARMQEVLEIYLAVEQNGIKSSLSELEDWANQLNQLIAE